MRVYQFRHLGNRDRRRVIGRSRMFVNGQFQPVDPVAAPCPIFIPRNKKARPVVRSDLETGPAAAPDFVTVRTLRIRHFKRIGREAHRGDRDRVRIKRRAEPACIKGGPKTRTKAGAWIHHTVSWRRWWRRRRRWRRRWWRRWWRRRRHDRIAPCPILAAATCRDAPCGHTGQQSELQV